MVTNVKECKTSIFLRWLQLSKRQLLTFLPESQFAMRRPGVWVVVITSGPLYMCARTLVECSWKFAEILPRMKNLEARFEVQISLAYQ